jgi:hypothetical protein
VPRPSPLVVVVVFGVVIEYPHGRDRDHDYDHDHGYDHEYDNDNDNDNDEDNCPRQSRDFCTAALGQTDILDGRTVSVELLMAGCHMASSLSIQIATPTPTPIALRPPIYRVVQVIREPFLTIHQECFPVSLGCVRPEIQVADLLKGPGALVREGLHR